MNRLKAANSVPLSGADRAPTTGTAQYATDGVPGSVPRTIWPAYAWNMVQDEVINVIEAADITPDDGDWTQLLQAIRALIGGGTTHVVPTGGIIMWSGSTSAIPAGWFLCDGTNGTPNLEDKFIIGAGGSQAVGATGGASSVTPTTSSSGAHSHGGATTSSGPWGISGSSDNQGTHSHGGNTGSTAPDMNAHTHGMPATAYGVTPGSTLIPGFFNGSAQSGTPDTTSTGSSSNHDHSIASDGLHSHNITVSDAPAHTHGIDSDGAHTHSVTVATVPPFYALAFIMKS